MNVFSFFFLLSFFPVAIIEPTTSAVSTSAVPSPGQYISHRAVRNKEKKRKENLSVRDSQGYTMRKQPLPHFPCILIGRDPCCGVRLCVVFFTITLVWFIFEWRAPLPCAVMVLWCVALVPSSFVFFFFLLKSADASLRLPLLILCFSAVCMTGRISVMRLLYLSSAQPFSLTSATSSPSNSPPCVCIHVCVAGGDFSVVLILFFGRGMVWMCVWW